VNSAVGDSVTPSMWVPATAMVVLYQRLMCGASAAISPLAMAGLTAAVLGVLYLGVLPSG